MKICAVTTWPPHKDGVALYSSELYPQISKIATVQVISNCSQKKISTKNNISLLQCWNRGLFYPIHIFRSVYKSRCNVVHLQHGWFLYGGAMSALLFPFLLVTLRLSRKPCIVTMHTVIRKNATLYKNSMINFLAKVTIIFLSRSIVHFSDKVILHNKLMKRILQLEYGSNTANKITIIRHGTKTVTEKRRFQNKDGVCILSLGFLRKEKDINNLIDAFKILIDQNPKINLVIVGTRHVHDKSNYVNCLKRSVLIDTPKNLVFTGYVNDQTLENLLWASEIIVLQSTEPHYVEASGTLATVANYGKALVCSKVPKFQSELKNGKNCLFVNPNSPVDLLNALILLVESKNLRIQLGKNLKLHFIGTNWCTIAKQHFALYKNLLEIESRTCTKK